MRTQVDASIFQTSPLVGAYLICCSPTSVMVNTILDERFGEIGWQSEVESAVRQHLIPLGEQARRVIQEHRFYIRELYNHVGVLARSKKGFEEMLERKGKHGYEGFGSDSLPAALIG